jgi:GNAT superfamily N-acetyltransferase
MLRIEKIVYPHKIKDFIDFPHELYKGDPAYVPEIYLGQKDLLNPKKHPFYEHSKLDMFLCYKDDKIVGRIAAIRNNNHIKSSGKQEGFFGFFECIEDYEVAKLLFDTAKDWIKKEGLISIVGPTSFSTNEIFAWHIDAFNIPPMMSMGYNKNYYPKFAEQYGFKKKVDLFAYLISRDKMNEKSIRVTNAFEERLKNKGITIRTVNMKTFKEDAEQANDVYNAAWEKNDAFVPMTKKEFMHLANDMKMIMDPTLCFLAEHEGKIVGFSFSFPDINQVLIKVKRGRLLPTGILKLLFGRKGIKKARIVVLGVIEGYRKMGIEACFYGKTMQWCKDHGITNAEASLILESNTMMNQGLININAEVYKTYRLYEMPL